MLDGPHDDTGGRPGVTGARPTRPTPRRSREADDLRLFISSAVHEFRTPLAALSGFATYLRRHWDELDEDDKLRYVDIIGRQAVRLSSLTSDLLEMSRVDAGVIMLEPARVVVGEVIADAIESVGPGRYDVRCPVDLRVIADAGDLREMLVNYLSNARKYGEPPIEITVEAVDDFALVRVIDHGPGIPEDFVPHLFHRFRRARTAGVQDKSGTGLGLAIVRGLTESQGGRAWYEPSPQGATFCFTLPIADGRRLPVRDLA